MIRATYYDLENVSLNILLKIIKTGTDFELLFSYSQTR